MKLCSTQPAGALQKPVIKGQNKPGSVEKKCITLICVYRNTQLSSNPLSVTSYP